MLVRINLFKATTKIAYTLYWSQKFFYGNYVLGIPESTYLYFPYRNFTSFVLCYCNCQFLCLCIVKYIYIYIHIYIYILMGCIVKDLVVQLSESLCAVEKTLRSIYIHF